MISEPRPKSSFETRTGLRYDDLKFEVRSYVDKLHVQIDAILHKYGVKNPQEFAVKMKEKGSKIDAKDRQRVIELVGALIEAYRKDEAPNPAIETAERLSNNLNKRAQRFGLDETYEIHPPSVPEGLTAKHLEIAKQELGLEPAILPTAAELHNLDENYLKMMYPEKQNEDDKKEGLVSYRSSSWKEEWFKESVSAYLRSMKAELSEIGGSFVLLDTAIKPNGKSGSRHYGTIEGDDPTKDPLLPFFKQAFGKYADRYTHTWGELNAKLIPLIKQALKKLWPDLSESAYDVQLSPAVANSYFFTFRSPSSSTTETSEWISTKILDDKGGDTFDRLCSGSLKYGGAGYLDSRRVNLASDIGARLAVVFKRTQSE